MRGEKEGEIHTHVKFNHARVVVQRVLLNLLRLLSSHNKKQKLKISKKII